MKVIYDAFDKVPIYAWTDGVQFEAAAEKQVHNIASLPFIHHHVAVMPDVHFGIGATVGSVIPTRGAIIPAAVGVDIGCGMIAQDTGLKAEQLPESLALLRDQIEKAVPVGQPTRGQRDSGSWGEVPTAVGEAYLDLTRTDERYHYLITTHGKVFEQTRAQRQLGTLGGRNHYIE